jgi:hypothetical protein
MAPLLAAGADVHRADASGLTPCHVAAMNSNAGVLARLIRAGANINAAGGPADKSTPCHCAVLERNVPALTLLLAAGCDVDRSHWLSAVAVADSYAVLLLLMAAGVGPAPGCALVADDVDGIADARRQIHRAGFEQIRVRATEICFALQSLQLPALQTILILIEACEPFAVQLDFHVLWNLVVTIKHHHVSA